uniref:Uncharacterized protein n=1 Tax=Spironucleus salmonicida TaxID=348837 RepID=V6LEV0_9EUKA|eukprot:EST42793.1 Hypothetical protein SS50377_17562 [Spironucleus salmonicida]
MKDDLKIQTPIVNPQRKPFKATQQKIYKNLSLSAIDQASISHQLKYKQLFILQSLNPIKQAQIYQNTQSQSKFKYQSTKEFLSKDRLNNSRQTTRQLLSKQEFHWSDM